MLKTSWTPHDDEALSVAITSGVSLQRLTVRFKRSTAAIKSRVKHLGLTPKSRKRLALEERNPFSTLRKR